MGFKILNFNIWGDFLKNEYFGGMKKLWMFFFFWGGGHCKTGLFFWGGWSFVYILGLFLKGNVQNGNIVWGSLKFLIFFGMPKFLMLLGGKERSSNFEKGRNCRE